MTTAEARDRIRKLAEACDIPMGEVIDALSYAGVGELLRCSAVKARTEAWSQGSGLLHPEPAPEK